MPDEVPPSSSQHQNDPQPVSQCKTTKAQRSCVHAQMGHSCFGDQEKQLGGFNVVADQCLAGLF